MPTSRHRVTRAHHIVVKIGSAALASDPQAPNRLANAMANHIAHGRRFAIVTSGAIAIGCERLGYRSRPKEVARLQAAAAAGQSVLMRRYDEAFRTQNVTAAQVLLTYADLTDRERANNAREAVAALWEAGAVPVINENDTVATEEIRFGDNDQLAAMVAPLFGADLLILLTDVEGVLDAQGKRISILSDDASVGRIEHRGPSVGTGGMQSKLDAARKAARSGACVVIASSTIKDTVERVLAGEDVGTVILPSPRALRARKHWIAFTLRPRGTILVDQGAVQALAQGRCSLLPVGILGVRGDFHAGDAVRLVGPDGAEVGRGLCRLGALEVARAAGKKGPDLELMFGRPARDVLVVHKDDLVTEL